MAGNPKPSGRHVMDAFYVTITKSERPRSIALAAGPFPSYEEAQAKEEDVRTYVLTHYTDPSAHFWLFGSARMRFKGQLPLGKLNERLGITPTA